MALAWHLKRVDKIEAELAELALRFVISHGAVVPALWFAEVANGLLVAERRKATREQENASFRADLALLPLTIDSASPDATLSAVLAHGRSSKLTAYDATYLELALRTGSSLATFDRQLADAVRQAGGRVFGDPE